VVLHSCCTALAHNCTTGQLLTTSLLLTTWLLQLPLLTTWLVQLPLPTTSLLQVSLRKACACLLHIGSRLMQLRVGSSSS
jgi:hypothetical protein